MPEVIPEHGERALVVGHSGSGKSIFARWLCYHLPGTVIYDTKGEPAFDHMGPIVTQPEDIWPAFSLDDAPDWVVYRPEPDLMANPMALDAVLGMHYEAGGDVGAYIDEAYQFHRNGQAGRGLVALLTRGRSRGITTIVGAQRPAWLSRFALSEANRIYALRLNHREDMQRIAELLPRYDRRPRVPRFYWDYAEVGRDRVYRFPPIDIDYRPARVDSTPETEAAAPPPSSYFTWL